MRFKQEQPLLLLNWGLQATEAFLASSGVTGEEPTSGLFQGHSGRKPEFSVAWALKSAAVPPLGNTSSPWTSALPLTSWPAAARGTRVLASVHGFRMGAYA